MADFKNLTDNGSLLTLGLVGVVAAAGAFAKRGSMARSGMAGNMRSKMGRIRDHLNRMGFSFEEMDASLLVDDGSHLSIRRDGRMVEVAKRIEDRDGNLVSMKTLGEFDLSDLSGIEAAARRGM